MRLLEKNPCDRGTAVDLLEKLNSDYDEFYDRVNEGDIGCLSECFTGENKDKFAVGVDVLINKGSVPIGDLKKEKMLKKKLLVKLQGTLKAYLRTLEKWSKDLMN